MKSLVFDTGPIISLTMNNLLWLLKPLKKSFNGEFYISEAVKYELIDKPLQTKRFKFEAVQVMQYINDGTLKVIENAKLKDKTDHLLKLANSCFKAKGNYINILHYGDVETVAAVLLTNAEALVIDERTTRELIESPQTLSKLLSSKLHTKIDSEKSNIEEFSMETKGIKIIRSVELVTMAYEMGLLDSYLEKGNIKQADKRTLLEAALWGVKLNGCAVSKEEINNILKLEIK